MKVTLHLEGSRQQVLDQIAEFTTVLNTSLAAQKPAAEKKAEGKPGKPGKPAKKEEVTEASDDFPEETGDTGADESAEDDGGDFGLDDDEPVEEKKPEGPSLADVQNHIKKYAAKGAAQKDRAKKLMAKLGIKSMDKIDSKHFASILKNLK